MKKIAIYFKNKVSDSPTTKSYDLTSKRAVHLRKLRLRETNVYRSQTYHKSPSPIKPKQKAPKWDSLFDDSNVKILDKEDSKIEE